MNDNIHPKLFISYSWDGQDHQNWVLKLANNLCKHGVDVILGQWDTRIGSDLTFFMEQGLTKSKLVVCVCSEGYVQKAAIPRGGVGYEKRIISADLLDGSNKCFIIPIIRNNPEKQIPTILKGFRYLDFSNDENYVSNYGELLSRI